MKHLLFLEPNALNFPIDSNQLFKHHETVSHSCTVVTKGGQYDCPRGS